MPSMYANLNINNSLNILVALTGTFENRPMKFIYSHTHI